MIEISDWVLVDYFGEQYPGKIVNKQDTLLIVSCLEKAGTHFKYPIKDDVHPYPIDDIVAILNEPELVNTRGFYSYSVKQYLKK